MRKLLLAALSSVLALGGCAGIVGPNINHDDNVQSVQNTGANVSRVSEGDNKWADVYEGPLSSVSLPGGGIIRKTGQVTNDATIQFKNGTAATVTFAQDVVGKGFEFTPDGGLKISEFGGNSTSPLNAYAVIAAQRAEILKGLSADQRAVYEKATQAYVDSIKELGPLVLQGVKAALGVP